VFDIEICEARGVALVRFHGELTEADFAELDALGSSTRQGPRYDVVYDMSGIERAHLATDFVARRGGLPQANAGHQRLYVVPQDDLKLLVRLYATYQANAGWQPLVLVDTLDEALARLQVARSDFKPYPLRRTTG
jgi:hypothetical protein